MQGIPDWQEGQDYKEGDEVVYKGKIYEAIRDISNACLRPNKNSAWTKLDDRIPIKDETIPCSIPQELVDAINAVLSCCSSLTKEGPIGNVAHGLKQALDKALRGQCTMHQSLQRQQELEDAEELLTKVCHKFDNDVENFDIQDVPGLIEWWAKRKPKSEREKKLEKIEQVITAYFDTDVRGNMPLYKESAEHILKALEEG